MTKDKQTLENSIELVLLESKRCPLKELENKYNLLKNLVEEYHGLTGEDYKYKDEI